MVQTLNKNWYLLALCGFLNAISSAIYLVMYNAGPDSIALPGWRAEVTLLSKLLVASGACAIAAAIWKPAKGTPWPLLLNGLALGAYGVLPFLAKAISFRPFALLVVVMSLSLAVLAATLAPTRNAAGKWLFGLAVVASVGFALEFLALAKGWIQLERTPFHPALFLWFCAFFGFSAICTLGLALRLPNPGASQSDPGQMLPLANPKHAH